MAKRSGKQPGGTRQPGQLSEYRDKRHLGRQAWLLVKQADEFAGGDPVKTNPESAGPSLSWATADGQVGPNGLEAHVVWDGQDAVLGGTAAGHPHP